MKFLRILLLPLLLSASYLRGEEVTISASNLCVRLGLSHNLPNSQCASFTNATHQLIIPAGRRRAELDGHIYWLASPPTTNWLFSAEDVEQLSILATDLPTNNLPALRVVVDPGHGGQDDGAIGVYPCIIEKDLTLDLALQLQRLAEPPLEIVLTRTNDTTLTLPARVAFAKATNANLFVSIHANYASNTNAAGIETYAFPPYGFGGTQEGSKPPAKAPGHANVDRSTALAWSIHQRLCTVLANTKGTNAVDRGLKRANFHVLRENPMPATLLEVGFLSNEPDSHALTNAACRTAMAKAILEGIRAYGEQQIAREDTLRQIETARMAREKDRAESAAKLAKAKAKESLDRAWKGFKLDLQKRLKQAKQKYGAPAVKELLQSWLEAETSEETPTNESNH